MSQLLAALDKKLSPFMVIPEEFKLLYNWIEKNGTFEKNERGLWGTLHDHEAVKKTWTENARDGGTIIEFHAYGSDDMGLWLGSDELAITQRVTVFAQTGGDGSMAGFWVDDDGVQKIVHLGSGSGSVMVCELATDPVDFFRLLAIGYDEICWNEEFDRPPNSGDGPTIAPNQKFRDWVCDTFKTTIPKTARELLPHTPEMGDEKSSDPFWNWVEDKAGN